MPPSLIKVSKSIRFTGAVTILDPEIREAAHQMKLLLVSHDTASRTGRVSIAEYKALMNLLNTSTISRVNLEHQLNKSNSPDECVIVAMNLLRLTVLFHAGPLYVIVVSVLARLRQTLARTTLEYFLNTTPSCINLYIWACFVGLVNEFESENRFYFVEMISTALSAKYLESSWPDDWQTRELDTLRSFLWSDAVLTKLYFDACQRVEAHGLTPASQTSSDSLPWKQSMT